MNVYSELPGNESTTGFRKSLIKMIGGGPKEDDFKARQRLHQGWWRAFVLGLAQGEYNKKNNEGIVGPVLVCNRIRKADAIRGDNFITAKTREVVKNVLETRSADAPGLIQKDRLYTNLLSSQPLAFNFFGELLQDLPFGLQILQIWWPQVTHLRKVLFEFAPAERFSKDNSAFDVAFEVQIGGKVGLIGLECKYTDSFSSEVFTKPEYKDILEGSSNFKASYDSLTKSRFNQLFRNQLIAEGILQKNYQGYSFAYTGLFCHPDDHHAQETGIQFQQMLAGGSEAFKVITFQDFIERIQQLQLTWEQRQWTMLLWARYLGYTLSEQITSMIED